MQSIFLIDCDGISKKITIDKFNKVSSGMSYSQVATIMHDPGEMVALTSMPPIPGIMPGIKNRIYIWKNYDGSNINVQFQNDKAIGKNQAGL